MGRASQIALNSGKNIQRSLNLVAASATAMAASVLASMTAVIAKGEDFAFTVAKMAEQTGTTSDMFSKLAYSAKIAGTPLDVVKTSMERLAKTAFSAQSGQKEAIAAYGALGISVRDLQGPLKDSGALLVAVSKGLDKYGESTAKTGLEQKLLGRSGSELAPLLKQLASGFDTASQQATLFGVVVGDKTAAQAKRLHDSMEQLESISLGFALRMLDGVSPALEDASNKLLKFVTSSDGMKTVESLAHDVSQAVYGLGNAFQFLGDHSTAVKRTLEGLALLQVASIFLPMVSGASKAGTGFDTVGLAGIKMVGRLSGISAVLPILKRVTDALKLQAFMVTGLWREEGFLAAWSYAAAGGLNAVNKALLANPYTAVALVLTAVGVGFYNVSQSAMKAEVDGGRWSDVWHAGLLGVKEDLNDVRKVLDLFNGDFADFASRKWQFTPFEGLVQQAGRARRGVSDDVYRMMHAKDLQPVDAVGTPKLDAPALPKEQADKVDHLKLKMDELAAAAKSAQDTLRDAGKGVDFERADEIAKEYTKTIIELEAQLKAQHKTLSDADKAAIRTSIATRINDLSQAKYREELTKSTDSVLSQAQAQDILTMAIGKGASAVRSAAIAANANRRDAGQSEEWKRLNVASRAQNDAAFATNYDRSNASGDTQGLAGVQAQINAQLRLNAAIAQGSHAKQEAALADEQDSIRKRYADKGDTNTSALNAELAANEKLFNLKRDEADLSRAVSMDPAAVFREQAAALQDAASAARSAGIAIDQMQLAAANKQAWQSYLDSVDKTTLAVGSASDGVRVFFSQMGRSTESAAQQVHDVLGGAFASLNDTLLKLVEGQKMSFASFFRGISESLAKLAIQKTEQSIVSGIMGGLGGGKQSAASSAVGAIAPLASLVPGGSILSSIFGGHRALGGDVTAGVTYDVGEMGRESFTPTQNGKITPNNRLTGGITYAPVIDARGSNDPAQTEAAIHRAMSVYGPVIAHQANKAASETKLRRPGMSR